MQTEMVQPSTHLSYVLQPVVPRQQLVHCVTVPMTVGSCSTMVSVSKHRKVTVILYKRQSICMFNSIISGNLTY